MSDSTNDLFTLAETKEAERTRRVRERVDKERRLLIDKLSRDATNDLRTRTAFILRDYPETRNSDRKLVPAYWKVFDRTEVHGESIAFDALAKVTDYTSIVRARQKIQNEYGLFVGETAVVKERERLAGEQRESQRRSVYRPDFIHIFADESGKTQPVRVVGSVWISGTLDELAVIQQRLRRWKKDRSFQKEFHFNDVSRAEVQIYVGFVAEILRITPKIGFKAVGAKADSSARRSIDDVVSQLYARIVLEGAQHEVVTGRATLPRTVLLYKDKDEGTDVFWMKDLRDSLSAKVRQRFDGGLIVQNCTAISSAEDELIQLADVFAGSVNRRFNRQDGGSRNHKDEVADTILGLLGLPMSLDVVDATSDLASIEMLNCG